MEVEKKPQPRKPNGKTKKNTKKRMNSNPKPRSTSGQRKKNKEVKNKEPSNERRRTSSKNRSNTKEKSISAHLQESKDQDLHGGDSLSGNLKYFRNESLHQIIKEKTECAVSRQAITFLAASMEFVASELIAESLRHSLNNRIVPKAIFKSIEDDIDLADLFKDGVVLDNLPVKKGEKLKMSGYQIQ